MPASAKEGQHTVGKQRCAKNPAAMPAPRCHGTGAAQPHKSVDLRAAQPTPRAHSPRSEVCTNVPLVLCNATSSNRCASLQTRPRAAVQQWQGVQGTGGGGEAVPATRCLARHGRHRVGNTGGQRGNRLHTAADGLRQKHTHSQVLQTKRGAALGPVQCGVACGNAVKRQPVVTRGRARETCCPKPQHHLTSPHRTGHTRLHPHASQPQPPTPYFPSCISSPVGIDMTMVGAGTGERERTKRNRHGWSTYTTSLPASRPTVFSRLNNGNDSPSALSPSTDTSTKRATTCTRAEAIGPPRQGRPTTTHPVATSPATAARGHNKSTPTRRTARPHKRNIRRYSPPEVLCVSIQCKKTPAGNRAERGSVAPEARAHTEAPSSSKWLTKATPSPYLLLLLLRVIQCVIHVK